ncbi:tape measure protein [Bergeriella denitrificans]|uniref:tape measure protein n=1 Tax=Bergeriella denitrificans TaxID=494 RepID=UPI001FE5FA16|nr:tape measure protein [Bergeriella denitrificans]
MSLNPLPNQPLFCLIRLPSIWAKSRAEIKKLGSEGKLTADVIFKAISGASESFAQKAADMPISMGKALTVFQNNWKSMVSAVMNDTGIMSGRGFGH